MQQGILLGLAGTRLSACSCRVLWQDSSRVPASQSVCLCCWTWVKVHCESQRFVPKSQLRVNGGGNVFDSRCPTAFFVSHCKKPGNILFMCVQLVVVLLLSPVNCEQAPLQKSSEKSRVLCCLNHCEMPSANKGPASPPWCLFYRLSLQTKQYVSLCEWHFRHELTCSNTIWIRIMAQAR